MNNQDSHHRCGTLGVQVSTRNMRYEAPETIEAAGRAAAGSREARVLAGAGTDP